MLSVDRKHRWMFAVEIAVLLHGTFLKTNKCDSSAPTEPNLQKITKNQLIISAKQPNSTFRFPTDVFSNAYGYKLCFKSDDIHAGCCKNTDFNCNIQINGRENIYTITLNRETLSKHDVVLMNQPEEIDCMPSTFYMNSDRLPIIDNYLNKGTEIVRLSLSDICHDTSAHDEEGLAETQCKCTIINQTCSCVSCMPPEILFQTDPQPESNANHSASLESAVKIMNNLPSILEGKNRSTFAINNVTGVITKLPPADQTSVNIGFASDDIHISEDIIDLWKNCSRLVHIPKEASEEAIKRNGSFIGVALFPGISYQDNSDSFFLNNEVIGIEMGAEIWNLSDTIDIHYKNVDKNGKNASCWSWDGKGEKPTWNRDGCHITEIDNRITCHCSHLTFFAILMSPPPGNISSSDFASLTCITSIGCGLSMFFLAVALFMHCLIRKGKASQATKILMNLFVAMFTLNLSFLTNQSIADLGNFGACLVIAAVMHYTMLATFTWFFIEALHLYFNLWKLPTEIKHYMVKICFAGWVTPAPVVIALLTAGKYDYMDINTDDGNSAKMCWISDAVVHQGVNIGYYAAVFIFTLSIFIITVRQIFHLKPAEGKAQGISSIRKNLFSILGLTVLLGITWAFAFFSYGPMLTASYYIFTILNSFQGFFLFIYYYISSKSVEPDGTPKASGDSSTTSDTVITPQ